MKHSTAFWIAVIACICIIPLEAKENTEATAQYEKSLEKLKAGDFDINFKEFRFNCVDSKHSCEADSDLMEKLSALMNEEKFKEALEEADKALEGVFVDIDLHFLAFIANMELGNEERAESHKNILRGLLDSIQEDKRGRTPEDAFEVINVGEEYTFLRFSGMSVKGQELINKDGHSYDVMTCINMDDDSELKVYFNVDISMNKLKNLFGD